MTSAAEYSTLEGADLRLAQASRSPLRPTKALSVIVAEFRRLVQSLGREASVESAPTATRPGPQKGPAPVPYRKVYSQRAFARLFNKGRGSTIAPAVADGRIRTVLIKGRREIPASEVSRILEEGLPAAPARRRARAAPSRTTAPTADERAEIHDRLKKTEYKPSPRR
jgi:hypothetical protein